MATAFFSDILATITDRGRSLLGLPAGQPDPARLVTTLVDLCEQLLSGRGEASGAALAREVLNDYALLTDEGRVAFFTVLATKFGPDAEKVAASVAAWNQSPDDRRAADLHFYTEPRRQELFRRLNRAPGGTAALVNMRADLLRLGRKHPELLAIDRDFSHLLASWFNRGFLVLRRIDWSSPASILEKIIRYEAVHEIQDWDDLRRRIDPVDRRCYAFFHPALADEPLIFVEVALTEDIPGAVQPLLAADREEVRAHDARTAVFYSISNCQQGLAGVSFGSFLIKQVVEELRRELPKLETFVTLSPVPGFMRWFREEARPRLNPDDRELSMLLEGTEWADSEKVRANMRALLEPLAAHYFLEVRGPRDGARDPVARFHLGNGARLERINWLGDRSPKGFQESAGIMVNYVYDLGEIERNHEAYANQREIVASSQVKRLLRGMRNRLQAGQDADEDKSRIEPPSETSPPAESAAAADAHEDAGTKTVGDDTPVPSPEPAGEETAGRKSTPAV